MNPATLLIPSTGTAGGGDAPDIDPPPAPREALAEEWEQFGVDRGTVFVTNLFVTDITAHKYIEKFENTALRQTVRRRTVDRFPDDEETVLMAFFCARLSITPNISSVPVMRRVIMNRARDATKQLFEDDLADKGLTDVREVNASDLEVDDGTVAELYRYEAAFPAPTTEVPLVDETTLVIDPGEMAVEGALAIWRDDGDIIIAGGAYPAEDFEHTVVEDVTESVQVTVEIELGLDPAAYERTLFGLIESMGQSAG